MELFFTVLSIIGFGVIGYAVGYFSGALTGIVIYYKKAEREAQANDILDYLDRTTVWETNEHD